MATMTVRLASINAGLLDTFREETTDGLDRLESKLLALLARRDPALVDELFRTVHTIKGGAGTFGMMQMARLAHRMESVLDIYRQGAEPTRAAVTALLDSCDALRRLLGGGPSLPDKDRELERRLDHAAKQAAGGPAPASSGTAAPPPLAAPASTEAADPPATRAMLPTITTSELVSPLDSPLDPPFDPHGPLTRHTIQVAPTADLFRLGVDPVVLFDQLTSLGELTAAVDVSAVPPLAELDPERCHLRWTLTLVGGDAEVIHALFGWLEDICPIAVESQIESQAESPIESPIESDDAAQTSAIAPAPSTALVPASSHPPAITTAPLTVATTVATTASTSIATAPAPAATIRVRLDKLDALMALVGELVVTQSTLCALGQRGSADPVRQRGALDDLQRLTRSLQQSALQLRSMPISSVLDRFPRLVHDLAGKLGKEIALQIGGDTIELDKTVLERIGDPLVHLIRNCIDHGIEPPDVREAAGKPRTGTIQLAVEQRGDEVTLEITDDGRGLDAAKILRRARERDLVPPGRALTEDEIHRLIFLPGFSTADQVSELSGRGVGMDVVVRTIQELGGDVVLRSRLGLGMTITLRLPVTLAIIEGQLVRFGGRTWVVPMSHVIECCRLDSAATTRLLGQRLVYRVGDDLVPMLDLCERLAVARTGDVHVVLIVEGNGQRRALMLDELGPRQQIVIKGLSEQLARVPDLAGAAVLGDGSIAFILDIVSLCASDTEPSEP